MGCPAGVDKAAMAAMAQTVPMILLLAEKLLRAVMAATVV